MIATLFWFAKTTYKVPLILVMLPSTSKKHNIHNMAKLGHANLIDQRIAAKKNWFSISNIVHNMYFVPDSEITYSERKNYSGLFE